MHRLQEKYNKKVIPAMMEKFAYKNRMEVPKINKVIVNTGTGQGLRDPKFLDVVESTFIRITGQKPVKTKSKKSISAFKIRKGMTVGLMTTLRGVRMLDFVDKLVNVTFPRVRDFRGLDSKSFDKEGNFNIGFKEHMAFPEIQSDEVEKIHGLEIAVVTNASNKEEGLELLKLLGFPIKE